jgi:HlyD family secretion protein
MDRVKSQKEMTQRTRGQWLKAGVALVVVILLLMQFRSWITPSIGRDSIRLATVEQGDIVATVTASGVIKPRIEEIVSSEINSRVVQVLARAGQSLKSGDELLKLDTSRIKLELDSLEERIALNRIAAVSKQLQSDKLFNDLKGRYELLEVDLESRVNRAERLGSLQSTGAVSKGDLEEARLDVRRTRIELRQIAETMDNLLLNTDAEIEGIALERSILEKELREQQRLIDGAVVKAPRDGVLTWILDEEGTSVATGAPLTRIADLSAFNVEATISDFYAAQLTEGSTVIIDMGEKNLDARLSTILPALDQGSVNLEIDLADPSQTGLQANLRVDAHIVTGQSRDTLRVKNGHGPVASMHRIAGSRSSSLIRSSEPRSVICHRLNFCWARSRLLIVEPYALAQWHILWLNSCFRPNGATLCQPRSTAWESSRNLNF